MEQVTISSLAVFTHNTLLLYTLYIQNWYSHLEYGPGSSSYNIVPPKQVTRYRLHHSSKALL